MKTEERKKKFLKALEERIGIISSACKDAGISRAAYYKWIGEDESFRKAAEDIQASQIDYVESKLIDRITAEDTTAIIYYLKAKGKERGWNENYDIVRADKEAESYRVRAISPIELMQRQEAKKKEEDMWPELTKSEILTLVAEAPYVSSDNDREVYTRVVPEDIEEIKALFEDYLSRYQKRLELQKAYDHEKISESEYYRQVREVLKTGPKNARSI